MGGLRVWSTLVGLWLILPGTAFGQTLQASAPEASPPVIDLRLSTSAVSQNGALVRSVGTIANWGFDQALQPLLDKEKGRHASAVALRLVKLYFVTLPTAAV